MRNHGFLDLFNYVVDIIYCVIPSKIHPGFQFLVDLLDQLGVTLNSKKLVSPPTSMVCLDISIDAETRTMSVPPEKLENIIQMCAKWQNKKYCSKR